MTKKFTSHISIDCVILSFDENQLKVLLVDREYKSETEPIIVEKKLPGSLICDDEDLYVAAVRVLNELTGLSNIYLKQFFTFGSPERIKKKRDMLWLEQTRGVQNITRIVSVGFFALVNFEEVTISGSAHWIPVSEIKELPFDHADIISRGVQTLRQQLRVEPVGFELLSDKFTLRQLQTLYEAVFDKKFDNRNFRKKVLKSKYIIPLAEKETTASKKPARLFAFAKDKYFEERETDTGFVL